MTDTSVTMTLHLWWLLAYLAVGVVLYLPLNWMANRQVTNRVSLLHILRRNGVINFVTAFVVQVVAWPLAVWELVR